MTTDHTSEQSTSRAGRRSARQKPSRMPKWLASMPLGGRIAFFSVAALILVALIGGAADVIARPADVEAIRAACRTVAPALDGPVALWVSAVDLA